MKHFILFLFSLLAISANAQTPFSMTESKPHGTTVKNGAKSAYATSLANPWVGAKFAYNTKGDVSNAFILSARVLYTPYVGERFVLPLVGNIGANNSDSLSQDNGFSLGAYPYYHLASDGTFKLIAHGGINYHVIQNEEVSVDEMRFLAGLEVALYPKDGGSPITLSVAPELVTWAGQSRTSLGISGIIPVALGLGALVETNVPLDGNASTGVKIGFIVNTNMR